MSIVVDDDGLRVDFCGDICFDHFQHENCLLELFVLAAQNSARKTIKISK
jgi:glyoxylase-like metal-dependent hydrolase (beta-lactamase superfamily II)